MPSTRLQLSLAYFLYFVTLGLVLPYFPAYLQGRGLDPVRIGWVMAAGPLARIVVPPLLGLAADRRRGPRFWGSVAAWGALAGLLLMWAPGGALLLYAGAVVYSLFAAPSMPLLDATTVRHAPDRFGLIRLWGSVGYVLTSFGLGALFPALPPGVIITSAAAAQGLFASYLTATRAGDAPVEGRAGWGDQPKVLRGSAVWLLLVTVLLSRMAAGPFAGFYIIFVGEAGYGGDVVALTWGIAITTEVCVMLAVDRLIDRAGVARVLAAGVLLDGLRWLFYAHWSSKAALLAVAPVHGLAFAMFYVSGVRALDRLVPRQFRAVMSRARQYFRTTCVTSTSISSGACKVSLSESTLSIISSLRSSRSSIATTADASMTINDYLVQLSPRGPAIRALWRERAP
jgi:PPP family 3-phenylpropionic acid transporter